MVLERADVAFRWLGVVIVSVGELIFEALELNGGAHFGRDFVV